MLSRRPDLRGDRAQRRFRPALLRQDRHRAIGGIGISEIAEETLYHHHRAFAAANRSSGSLLDGGQYQWRRDGEYHLFNPETVFRLQHATQSGRYDIFKKYTRLIDEQNERLCTLRGLFAFRFDKSQAGADRGSRSRSSEIVKRFATGAMSYGSISAEAHETLAIAMNRLGGKSNTGEGGEDPARYMPLTNGDSESAIKQVASGRFGVTSDYLVSADELQIKMAQGAKPGEGGQLPGNKVWPWIAKVRHSTPGVGLISPPPHHDIYSIEDLAQLIYDLKNSNPEARISVKLVAEMGVGTVAAGVAKAHSDVVLISGHDGGTGASPLTSLKHAGIPWELGLAETQQTLVLNKLRDRIIVQTDGQLKTGRDVVIAGAAGRRGVRLRDGAAGRDGLHADAGVPPGYLPGRHRHPEPAACARSSAARPSTSINFFKFVAQEVRELMAQLGFRKFDDMVGRSDLLDTQEGHRPLQGQGARLQQDLPPAGSGPWRRRPQDARPGTWDRIVARRDHARARRACRPWSGASRSRCELPIRNIHRTVGTILGSELTRRYGGAGLPDDTIQLKFNGHGRPELRRVPAARNHADARGRRQRLHRQGTFRRQDHRLPAQGRRGSSPRRTS